MTYAAKGFVKFFAANAAVILTIMLLPAFLVTGNIPFFEGVNESVIVLCNYFPVAGAAKCNWVMA